MPAHEWFITEAYHRHDVLLAGERQAASKEGTRRTHSWAIDAPILEDIGVLRGISEPEGA